MGRYSGNTYENPGDLKRRISGADPRPTESEIRESAKGVLVEGLDPDHRRTSEECPECGHKIPSVEEEGPDVPGFRETVEWVAENYRGRFTGQELLDLVAEAMSEVLDDLDPEEFDADAHYSLSEFGGPTLTFARSLAPLLLDGSKNATVRYRLDEEIRPGVRVGLKWPGFPFGQATVGDVIRTDLGGALDAIDEAGYRHNAESVGELWFDMNLYYEDDLGLSTEIAVVLLDDVEEI